MVRRKRLHILIGSTSGVVFLLALLAVVFPITATSATSSDVMDPYLQEQTTFSESATVEAIVLLPVLRRDPTPSPTTPSQSILLNGGFEQGSEVWDSYSSNGWQLILKDVDLLVPPHNGRWAAWLGGDNYETSILSQEIYIGAGATTLRYWHWIASEDVCNPDYDIAGAFINDTVVDAFLLCAANNSNGWIMRTVDLSAYAAQSVTLLLAAFTDGVLNSNLFLDDVSLGSMEPVAPGRTMEVADNTITKSTFLGISDNSIEVTEEINGYRTAINEFFAANLGNLPAENK